MSYQRRILQIISDQQQEFSSVPHNIIQSIL